MNKTKIEWCDYTLNPVKGLCPIACKYCYARAMYHRFKWDKAIRFEGWSHMMHEIAILDKPSKIFIGSTIELFGDWINPKWLNLIFNNIKSYKAHTFIFLTKQPWNLIKWSPFPSNCWIGMTVDNMSRYGNITENFSSISASVKFISFEPMLDYTRPDLRYVDWIVIGGMSPYSKYTTPSIYWVKDLTDLAKSYNIPVFHKDNLGTIFNADDFPMRREFPIKR